MSTSSLLKSLHFGSVLDYPRRRSCTCYYEFYYHPPSPVVLDYRRVLLSHHPLFLIAQSYRLFHSVRSCRCYNEFYHHITCSIDLLSLYRTLYETCVSDMNVEYYMQCITCKVRIIIYLNPCEKDLVETHFIRHICAFCYNR